MLSASEPQRPKCGCQLLLLSGTGHRVGLQPGAGRKVRRDGQDFLRFPLRPILVVLEQQRRGLIDVRLQACRIACDRLPEIDQGLLGIV